MKKFLKIFTIIVLVGLSIGGTCYFFYSNLVKQQDAYVRINTFLYSAEKSSVDTNLEIVNGYAPDKLVVALETADKLNMITETLNTYMIMSLDYDLDNNAIIERLESTIDKRANLFADTEEFIIKTHNQFFDPYMAINDVLKSLSNYIVRYAEMVKYMNQEIESHFVVNNNADIKFDIIELYCLTAIDSFANLEDNAGAITIDEANITLLNNHFELKNGVVVTNSDQVGKDFSQYNNAFISSYDSVDKTTFASELSDNISAVNEITDSSTYVEEASFYLKKILGIN